MSNKTFSRTDDLSRAGIVRLPDPNGESLENIPQVPPTEISAISTKVKNKIVTRTIEERERQEAEELSLKMTLIRRILDGEIFEYYDFSSARELEKEIVLAIQAFKQAKWADFVAQHETTVPRDEFEILFEKRKERIITLYKYQKTQAEIDLVFQRQNTPEWQIMTKKEYFQTSFIPKYFILSSTKCFNYEGFIELSETHSYLEELFAKGSFNEFGASLLSESIEQIHLLLDSITIRFPDYSDEFVTFLSTLNEVLENIQNNNWKFEKRDIDFLREAYKTINIYNDSVFSAIAKKIKEAIRRYRNPSIIDSGLLSENDKNKILLAYNIIRNTMGNGGQIRNVDLKQLQAIKTHIEDVLKFKDGLLTYQEIDTLKQLSCNLTILTDPVNYFAYNEELVKSKALLTESELMGKKHFDYIKSLRKEMNSPIQEFQIGATTIFDPLILEGKTESTIQVDESIHKEETFLRKIKYIKNSPLFNFLVSQSQEFFETLDAFEKSLLENDINKTLDLLKKLEIPDSIRIMDFIDNNLERSLLVEMAFIDLALSKQDVYFADNVSEHFKFFQEKKKELFQKIITASIFQQSIANIFVPNSYINRNLDSAIFANYSELKKSLIFFLEFDKDLMQEYLDFLIEIEALFIQKMIFETGNALYGYELHDFDPQNVPKDNFISESKKILDKLLFFASPRNFRPEFKMDEILLAKLRKVITFATDLKLIFSTLDDSLISNAMLENAIKRFSR
jgi:hypothetical protein